MTDLEMANQIKDGLYENADWYATNSVPKAQAYITWLTRAIDFRPSTSGNRESHVQFDIPSLTKNLVRAQEFVIANGTANGPRVTRAGFNSSPR